MKVTNHPSDGPKNHQWEKQNKKTSIEIFQETLSPFILFYAVRLTNFDHKIGYYVTMTKKYSISSQANHCIGIDQ